MTCHASWLANGRSFLFMHRAEPFSEMEPRSGGIELKHVGSDGRETPVRKGEFLAIPWYI